MSAGRYTAEFTGLLSLKKPGEYTYVRLREDSPEPGGCTMNRSRPPYGELGGEISIDGLREGRKSLALETYRKMWTLLRYIARGRGHIQWCQPT